MSSSSYGIDKKWDTTKLNNFKNRHETLEHEDYLLAVISENVFTKENAAKEIAQLIYNELVALTEQNKK